MVVDQNQIGKGVSSYGVTKGNRDSFKHIKKDENDKPFFDIFIFVFIIINLVYTVINDNIFKQQLYDQICILLKNMKSRNMYS